ncbi:MAG: histidine ammonia-lyase [Actinomycetota bacterium]
MRRVSIPVGGDLALPDVVAVAEGEQVELAPGAFDRMRASRAIVEERVRGGDTVYGVTTGIGSLATVRISPEQAARLQQDIVRSHATAVGPALSAEETRAMLLLRAHVLALGYSGVRPEIVELMIEMLNRDVLPVVPERGSLGASGDLAPLAHLALPLIGGGEAMHRGVTRAGAEALAAAGLRPVVLGAKEGLALVNGTQGMLAIGILAAERARTLARAADVVAAMSVEGALGTDRPFDERLHALRPHPGQLTSAANLRKLLAGSGILASHRESGHLVQDAYSLRCAPQVHGAFRDVLAFTGGVLEREASSVSDNPIVLPDDGEVVSGGNFHGAPVAAALDALAGVTVSLASISERRLYRLLDPALNNGLPAFLVPDVGLNSGMMLMQYTAASLVSESKWLAHPAAVDSIPSSAGQEDHVSMGMTSARHVRECVGNAEIVVALEALAAAQAIDLRAPLAPGPGTDAARRALRSVVGHLDADRELGPDIGAAIAFVRSELVPSVEEAVGPLD